MTLGGVCVIVPVLQILDSKRVFWNRRTSKRKSNDFGRFLCLISLQVFVCNSNGGTDRTTQENPGEHRESPIECIRFQGSARAHTRRTGAMPNRDTAKKKQNTCIFTRRHDETLLTPVLLSRKLNRLITPMHMSPKPKATIAIASKNS